MTELLASLHCGATAKTKQKMAPKHGYNSGASDLVKAPSSTTDSPSDIGGSAPDALMRLREGIHHECLGLE